MKNLMIIAGFISITLAASSTQKNMEVVNVSPVYKNVVVQIPVSYETEICYKYKRNSKGALEKIVDSGFGSTSGLVGAAAGAAIVDEAGGNSNAKVLGALLGNKIGNNISEQNSTTKCEMETKTKYESQNQERLEHYLITVVNAGDQFVIQRSFSPRVGEMVNVNISVN